jgi:serine/threonine protein kinase
MLVETITGERPFVGHTHHELLASLLHSEYHLPGESIEIRALDTVVQRCLAKDPRDRYGSAAEAAGDLVPLLFRCAAFNAGAVVVEQMNTRRINGNREVDSVAKTELES